MMVTRFLRLRIKDRLSKQSINLAHRTRGRPGQRANYVTRLRAYAIVTVLYDGIGWYMCIFQKSYALLGKTFSKLEKKGSFLGPTFFGTFFCQKYGEKKCRHPIKIVFFFNRQKSFLPC